MVSLLAPEEVVKQSLHDNYGDLVSPALLSAWQEDPSNAPGRSVSSPWPDRIRIISNQKISEGVYEVQGEIIEITSLEQIQGGYAAQRAINLVVKRYDTGWLIDAVSLRPYTPASITYSDTQFGFTFVLPRTWQGYSIVTTDWEGAAIGGQQDGRIVQRGPIVSIRHPQWMESEPRQDIPIMIFQINQWNSLQKEEFSVGAAPIMPHELGRNSRYVFALPARYNFAFPTGFEEVETILSNKPLYPDETLFDS